MSHYGDFIGFTFNGVHSLELGIVRVSNGSRYEEDLLPTTENKTVKVPGGDGTYYFGSYYSQKPYNIQIAYDSLTETQFKRLRELFGDKKIHTLIFDERPYKVYKAKVLQSPKMTYICFDEYIDGALQRVYKGEGTIQFTAFSPLATSRYKYLEDYTSANIKEWKTQYGNRDEWIESSGIKPQGSYDKFINTKYELWNPGDTETDFLLYFKFNTTNTIPQFEVSMTDNAEAQLNFNTVSKISSDYGIRINSKLNLIEGVNSEGKITGNIYNRYIKSGNFFKIPQGESSLSITGATPQKIDYSFRYY